MKLPKPNPEVYRRAAQLIASGAEQYSCVAIIEALEKMDVHRQLVADFYSQQFAAMFGPYEQPELNYINDGDYVHIVKRGYINSHPWWDKLPSSFRENQWPWSVDETAWAKCRDMKITTLLLMADIVEQGA